MNTRRENNNNLVFGLDIGTRNIVGTVGYRDENEDFNVMALSSVGHKTRAMLDGQIHDIGKVGKTIQMVKENLEEMIEQPLTEVCIAAAGRVLKTVTTRVDYEYPEETVVTGEMIHTLELLGVEKAQNILQEQNDTKYRFYCVGYSVVKYYINDEIYSNLEGHKAEVIAIDIIVTFLPEDVVDGLYAAVAIAGLEVANLTLEPIAAINVAIPEHFRMLNIALVDVGAGTSDICITKDGSIIAYGMIPFAGDEITEIIVQHYLVDFNTAEYIKRTSTVEDEVEFEDIMSITHRVPAKEVWELVAPAVDKMAKGIAEKIIELNGDRTVSATFIVGGGGKVHGFVEQLAGELDLPTERVALRGEEVLKTVHFEAPDIEKDPLIVTPIGICLNYYDQKNNFIMVRFNGERIKLYDNNRLTIVDAALQADFPNAYLFPRRGQAINFTVNGKQRMIRGEAGESAIVKMNGREVNINTMLEPNCEIEIIPSTVGESAVYNIGYLEEYTSSTIVFEVNHKIVTCPRFVMVNGRLEPPDYRIQEGDQIEVCNYYTVEQLAKFMDVEIDTDYDILVNNRVENMDAHVYENFSVDWTVIAYRTAKEDMAELSTPADDADGERGMSAIAHLSEASEDQTAEEPQPEVSEDEAEEEPKSEESEDEAEEEPESEESEDEAEEEPESEESEEEAEEEPESEESEDEIAEEPESEESEDKAEEEPEPEESEEEAEEEPEPEESEDEIAEEPEPEESEDETAEEPEPEESEDEIAEEPESEESEDETAEEPEPEESEDEIAEEPEPEEKKDVIDRLVFVNGERIVMHGKKEYVFIDVFDYVDFDLSDSRGRAIVTTVNDNDAIYTQALEEGDEIVIRWREV